MAEQGGSSTTPWHSVADLVISLGIFEIIVVVFGTELLQHCNGSGVPTSTRLLA